MIALETWNQKYKPLEISDTVSHSQQQEYHILEFIFKHCPPKNKWLVDIGACEGVEGSNSYDLIQSGWSGLLVEADDRFYQQLVALYLQQPEEVQNRVNLLRQKIDRGFFPGDDNLNWVLAKYPIPQDFDFLSVDVDSYEYEIWRTLVNYHPNVICIECNAIEEDINVINYDPSYSVKPAPYGSGTVGLYKRLGEERNYDLLCVEKCNAFLIDRDFGKDLLA